MPPATIPTPLTIGAPDGDGRLVREVSAEPASVAPLRSELTAWARSMGARDPDAIALAVSEACTNIVVHAYREQPAPGPIIAAAERRGTELQITIADRGCGLRPRCDSPGLGLGLALISRVAQRVAIEASAATGTTVCMTFAVRAASPFT